MIRLKTSLKYIKSNNQKLKTFVKKVDKFFLKKLLTLIKCSDILNELSETTVSNKTLQRKL